MIRRVLIGFLLFILTVGVYWAPKINSRWLGPTPYLEPSWQAEGFLHGHAWTDAPGFVEQVHVRDKVMLIHPPMAALLMMPWVAALGVGWQQKLQPLVAILIAAFSVVLAWRMTESLWLTAFYALGTTIGYEAAVGASWDIVVVSSLPFTMLALTEVLGRNRAWLVGLWAGLAMLGRYDLALALPFYLALSLLRLA